MAKIKLGARPKSFKRTVKFPMLEGGEGAIEVSFKYRTRSEFGAFLDEVMAAGKARAQEQPSEDLSVEELHKRTAAANTDYILQIADGWNLDEEFSHANVLQLCDELPGAANAVMEIYRVAINEGRLGN
ncbi:hypothetical protein GCM10028796_17010 [Ramlibacter monticola]|uniref:Tail assembly chaperone n=1 Tax=Ramlibacter monticola TaxID=1926872 RepID=A0A937CSI2_9BURK|nr:phage tail assembly chaperone [Ramlibacter monticola]MBL0390528.1 hypothetical protein [Ramlibacter monticola]